MREYPKATEFRDEDYEYWMAYYDRVFHNRPPSELSARQMAQKINLRAWLSEQQTKKHRPKIVQGFVPEKAPKMIRQRYRPANGGFMSLRRAHGR
jgi:hypothetical protein